MPTTDDNKIINREVTGLRQQPYADYYKGLIASEINQETNHLFNQATYDRLLRDDQVHASMMQRIASVAGSKWMVVRGGDDDKSREAADFIESVLYDIEWNNITVQMLWASFFGYSVAEVLYANKYGKIVIDDIKVRNREDFEWNINEKPVYVRGKNNKKIELSNPYFWWCRFGSVNNSELYGRGLAHQLYYPVVFKHAAINYNLDFLDKFANPTMVGELSEFDNDPQSPTNFIETIQALHGAGGTVLKNGEKLSVLESLRTGGDYDKFVQWCDDAISKTVLGQSMTIEDGTSRSFGKTMLEIRAERAGMDDDMVSGSFNQQIIPFLIDSNFNGAKYPKVIRDLEVRDDIESRSRADIRVFALGARPTQDYIEKTYGKGWVLPQDLQDPTKIRTDNRVVATENGAIKVRDDDNVGFADGDDPVDLVDGFKSGQAEVDKLSDEFADKLPEGLDGMVLPIIEFLDKNGAQKTFDRLSKLSPNTNMETLLDLIQSAYELSGAIGRTGK